jgi:DNA gyrase subunit A
MDDRIFDRVEDVDLKKKMEDSYIDYAMSVIASRALPDVRDGLKPVQRRILHSMVELNNGPDKPHRKCARIVGDTMGKYHPHGDSSIYGALVNMAQDWNMRYPLVDGHGNFGSVDGDSPAAMRYTEARLSKISMEMVADINKDTVNFVPNFDNTENEPTILPARFPNLLVNGTSGIAVGMATNIPPHNLRETIAAVVKIIDNRVEENRDTSIDEVMKIIKGPDFPTGAQIMGTRGIEEAYRTGRGKIRTRAVTRIEVLPNGKSQILVSELPYMVNKANLIKKIADLVKEKKIDGITDVRDHSSREGMEVCIETRRDANPNVILNQLFKHTQLQDTFGVIMLALVDGQPKILNLLQMLQYYLKHQEDVVTRRTRYDLNKAEERAHILAGLLKALDHIDEIIRTIRASANTPEAKENLMRQFDFSDVQAQAIVDMRLRALTGLERTKLENEFNDLKVKIEEYKEILSNEKSLLRLIKKEILEISEKYGDDRRTKISHDYTDLTTEDLIPDDNIVITMTRLGYIKRMTTDTFHSQNRGGKGIRGMQTLDNDNIEDIFMTTAHHTLLFFTNAGRVYEMKAYRIPEAGRTARGTAIINLLQMQPDEKVTAAIPIDSFNENDYLFMATKKGVVKKTPIMDYANIRKSGLTAIILQEDDELIEVKYTNGSRDIMLTTKNGMLIRFNESDVRGTGRSSMGVRGISLDKGDEVVSMQLDVQGEYILFVSENGYGKRTRISEFKRQHRGGKGLICYKVADKTGRLVGAKSVEEENEAMLITTEGIVIRFHCSDVPIIGRSTSGVRLMNVGDNISVASIAKVRDDEDPSGESADENGAGETDSSENSKLTAANTSETGSGVNNSPDSVE